jgi:quercetin dioxygenase-like cupin family protein
MTRRVPKPWGEEIIFALTDQYAGKILTIRKGESLSLQYHVKKDETIHLFSGDLRLVLDEDGTGLEEHVLRPGESYHVRPGTKHRMIAITDCDILEASTPEVDDVVRLEDAYGRAT